MADSFKDRLERNLKSRATEKLEHAAEKQRRTLAYTKAHEGVKALLESALSGDTAEYFVVETTSVFIQGSPPDFDIDRINSFQMTIRNKNTGLEVRIEPSSPGMFRISGQFSGHLLVYGAASPVIKVRHQETSKQIATQLSEDAVCAILDTLAGSRDLLTDISSRRKTR